MTIYEVINLPQPQFTENTIYRKREFTENRIHRKWSQKTGYQSEVIDFNYKNKSTRSCRRKWPEYLIDFGWYPVNFGKMTILRNDYLDFVLYAEWLPVFRVFKFGIVGNLLWAMTFWGMYHRPFFSEDFWIFYLFGIHLW